MGAGGWGGQAKVTKGHQENAEMGSISAVTHGPLHPPEGQTETQGKSRSGLRSHCETPLFKGHLTRCQGQEGQLRAAGMGGGDNQAKQPG